ncbi:MAG TPA: type II toxin-antitoxin system death-on-curing family toxin [Candidatus Didemnitutus sp.]|nr:type II toxin-antitoxin system death-on-curing family toxin [Candidatus Didemnitutus sp.]
MSLEWKHFTVETVKTFHAHVLSVHGGGEGLRDVGLLESAVAAPQAFWGGEPMLTDPYEIAAAYLFYLCRNHPFVDGNKRVGLAACLTFLAVNDLWKADVLPVDQWEAFVFEVAASKLDRDQTTKRLKGLIKPAKRKIRK